MSWELRGSANLSVSQYMFFVFFTFTEDKEPMFISILMKTASVCNSVAHVCVLYITVFGQHKYMAQSYNRSRFSFKDNTFLFVVKV